MNTFLETIRKLGPARLGAMAMVAAGILAFFVFLTSRLTNPDMALLYSELEGRDSAEIIGRLDAMNLPYRIGGGGSQIFVPSDQVGRLRIAMAEDGLPSGGSVGYEIFDRSEPLGTTNFVQGVNHLRALEGELARTIRSIGQVKQARVHLVLPRRELFSRDRQEPSASIALSLRGSVRLARGEVQAIQHLVASAVPGLQPGMVSIIDSKGTLLARSTPEGDVLGETNTTEELRLGFEARTARTVEELIERLVGPGNVRAEVAAEMDFDRITENAEIYDPDGQVVRSTQTVEETNNASEGDQPPPVTVGNNLPDAGLPELDGGTASRSETSRVEETVNYEITRTVKTHVRETGLVRRLSVAVLVNGTLTESDAGDAVYQPRSADELEQIAALVRSSVGFDEDRGDSLEVVNLRFAEVDEDFATGADHLYLGLSNADLMRMAEVLVLGVVGILLLVMVVRPLVLRMLEQPLQDSSGNRGLLPDAAQAHPALAPPGGNLPVPDQSADGAAAVSLAPDAGGADIQGMIDLNQVEGRVRASSVNKIGEIVDKHPEEAVNIVRTWLYQEGN